MENIELTEQEAKEILNYLAEKPLKESYDLFNKILNKLNDKKVKEQVDNNEG